MSTSRRLAAVLLALTTVGTACSQPADPAVPAAALGAPAGPPPEATAGTVSADSVAALGAETASELRRIAGLAEAQSVAGRPYGEIVQWVGEQLQGRPYTAGLLDAPRRETLIADLTQFDCVLYVENVLAVAHGIATGDTSPEAYLAEIRRMRYRDGQMDGYCSRLHYFSDWIANNEARGLVRNVTRDAGGVPWSKRITFMSEHRDAYPRLADDATFACAARAEANLAGLDLVYIPQDDIDAGYAQLRPGDVVAMATSIGGLDVTHTGFVHVDGAGASRHVGFMHASSASNAVKVSPDLADYVQGIRNQTGIVVARPTDPRLATGN